MYRCRAFYYIILIITLGSRNVNFYFMDEEIDREVKFHLTNNSWVQEFFEKLLILKIDG